jgi:hypothetical protein
MVVRGRKRMQLEKNEQQGTEEKEEDEEDWSL